MGLLLTLNRRLHRAYIRTRDFNFSIVGLTGIDLYKKTVGIIGTGRIGRAFAEICRGFGMRVLAYDKYPAPDFEYVSLDTLLRESDVISLHCPLSEESYHMLDREAFDKMKKGVFLLNTSRGALIDSEALLDALNNGTLRGAGLDVYEEEAKFFFEDHSDTAVQDDTLALLISRPNVILTAHQAFLTEEALYNIAEVTVQNLDDFFAESRLKTKCVSAVQEIDLPRTHTFQPLFTFLWKSGLNIPSRTANRPSCRYRKYAYSRRIRASSPP